MQSTSPTSTPSSAPHTYNLDTVGYYRTLDPIENFRLRIRFAKIADKNVPLSAATNAKPGKDNGSKDAPVSRSLPKAEELTVRWQQKVFSPREIIDYSHLPSNATPLHQKYHTKLQSRMAKPNSREARLAASGSVHATRKRLFTYIDGDGYIPRDDLINPLTTAPYTHVKPPTDDRLLTLRERCLAELDEDGHLIYQRRLAKQRAERARAGREEGRKGALNEVVKDGEGDERELVDGPVGEMHIMAFLVDRDEAENQTRSGPRGKNLPSRGADTGDEVIKRLCTIQVFKNGLIATVPDISNPTQRFRFSLNDDVYEYTIEDASPKLPPEEEEREQKIFTEYHAKTSQTRLSTLNTLSFNPPPELYSLRIDLFGEIVDARHFPSGTLYVMWFLDLPEGWKEDEEAAGGGWCVGQTQRSESALCDGEREAVFGSPVEVRCLAVRFDKIREWPKLYFQVNSVDYWDRDCVEGYGYMDVPRTPGCYSSTIQTWRPFGTYTSRMESFFIGGSPDLEDITYEAVPKGFAGSRLSKYGFTTESSGTVTVRMNVVHQAEMYKLRRPHFAGDVNKHLEGNVRAISDALMRARARLEALRQSKKDS
ncbi:Pleiotropic negative transcriptional regulator [Rhizophlyctis rosea]|nr:Pleiotropic negative transcriptional regulator [Rhizophlyctis rosea]